MISIQFLERISPNLGTIAVIPASTSVPIANFTFELSLALNEIGKLKSLIVEQNLQIASSSRKITEIYGH